MSKSKVKSPVVLQVLPAMETSGLELGAAQIATELAHRGIKNFVASSGGRLEHDLEKAKVPHFKLPLQSKNIFKMRENAKALEQFIKDNGINIVHARSRAPAWSAYWAAKAADVHYMTTFHGTYGLGPWGLKKLYNRVMTYGEKVIAISSHIKNHILKNYPKTPAENLVLVHRCVDISKYNPDAVSQERLINKIKEYHIPDDKKVILLGGRITSWKGPHLLIEALSKMKSRNFYCIIAGDAQGRDDYINRLKELVRKYRLGNKICIYDKVVLDMPAAMMAANVVCSAAIEPEAFGRTTAEGQAMGKIVVASNIGGSLDIINDGVNGKLFESNNAVEMAKALDWALNLSDKEAEKIGKAAIKNVKENFTLQQMCDKTIEVYHNLINK